MIAPIEAKDAIRRMCKLQAEVQEVIGYEHQADCFCGHSGLWTPDEDLPRPRRTYDGTHANGYRNDGVALEFIEDATRAALKAKASPPPRDWTVMSNTEEKWLTIGGWVFMAWCAVVLAVGTLMVVTAALGVPLVVFR